MCFTAAHAGFCVYLTAHSTGPCHRAPTPAGNLLGRHSFIDDDEDDDELDQEGCQGRLLQRDVEPCRDQGCHGSECSSVLALKASGSLAARKRYAQSTVALGEGVGVGWGVATFGGDERICQGKSSPPVSAAATVFGGWGGVDACGDAQRSGGLMDQQQTQGTGHPFPQQQQHNLWGGSAGVEEEEDDLANLMCDEIDFVTPPHSPSATTLGELLLLG